MKYHPYLLEHLYERLGKPRWYWPSVAALLLFLWGVGGAIAPNDF